MPVCLWKVIDNSSSKRQPLVITHCLIIQGNHSWKAYVHDHDVSECPALNSIPQQVNESSAVELLRLVDRLQVCPGQPENKFVEFAESKKGKLCSRAGNVVAYINRHSPVYLNSKGSTVLQFYSA